MSQIYPNLSKDDTPRFEKPINDIIFEVPKGGAIKILNPDESISEQQNKWLHCKGGPIAYLVKTEKMGFAQAKVFLKVKFGRDWFVKNVDINNLKTVKGVLYWECQAGACREIIHLLEVDNEQGVRCCPKCGNKDIKLIAVQSITTRSVNTVRKWFNEIIEAFRGNVVPQPQEQERE